MRQDIKKMFEAMTLKKKLEYIWMYYKGVFAAALLIIFAVWLGVTMYKGRTAAVALNVVIAGGDTRTAEWIEKDFTDYGGLTGGDGAVHIKAGLPESGEDPVTKTALTTLIGAEAVDVLICDKDIYREYHEQGGFLTMAEVLGEDADSEDALMLGKDNILAREGLIGYEAAYAAVPVNCRHKETAGAFLRYLQNR